MKKENKKLFQKLVKKYGRPKKIFEKLSEKYHFGISKVYQNDVGKNNRCEPEKTIYKAEKEILIKDNSNENIETVYEEMFFSYDEEKNKRIVEKLLVTYRDRTKKDLLRACMDKTDSETYRKLLKQYEEKINRLYEKKIWDMPEKLAENLKKIVSQTIIKSWVREDTQSILREYLKINGFGIIDFMKRHKITDDDLNYLNETFLSIDREETYDKSKDYQVIKMIQPIIRIAYDDDGEKEYKYLPGRCRFYVYLKKGK